MATIGLDIPTYGAFSSEPWKLLGELADGGGIDTSWVPNRLTLPEEDVRVNGGQTRIDESLDAWTMLAMLATSHLQSESEVTPLPCAIPSCSRRRWRRSTRSRTGAS
jgi:alkanesulfonate monooxygenase SsuD/methylene tetrahydromethanopterin reductase-like flavin-dependent oxidoreductase (luciferase family)